MKPHSDRVSARTSDDPRHRRLVLIGVGTLLLLSATPILGNWLATQLDAALGAKDHVLGICLIALHMLVTPVHQLVEVLLAAGVAYAIGDRVLAALRVHHVLSQLPVDTAARPALDRLAQSAGLRRDQVRVVANLPNPAFTAGWFTPRVYLARHVFDALNDGEVLAVLRHEAAHLRRRDPLRVSVMRFVACLLFWIPAFRRLADDLTDDTEIAADDAASREQPLALASAILTLTEWTRGHGSPTAALRLVSGDVAGLIERRRGNVVPFDPLLDRRIRRLAGEVVQPATRVTRRSVSTAALALAVVLLSAVAEAHPTATLAHGPHCQHRGLSALSHLLCRDETHAHSGTHHAMDCPHAHAAAHA